MSPWTQFARAARGPRSVSTGRGHSVDNAEIRSQEPTSNRLNGAERHFTRRDIATGKNDWGAILEVPSYPISCPSRKRFDTKENWQGNGREVMINWRRSATHQRKLWHLA